MADIIKKGKIKRKNGSNVEILLPYTTEDQVDGLVSDLDSKVDKVEGKSLILDTEITRLAGIETGAEVNIIETVKVDGVALTPDTDRAVNVVISGKVDKTQKIAGIDLQDDITVAELKSAIAVDNVVNTGDSATPVSGGTTKFTTGGAYTELNKKVDKVSTAKRIYGTDADGNQTTYDYTALGKVDDVKVDGTSVVTDKIANIDLTGKVDKTTTVQGKALSSDVVIYGSEIDADSGTSVKLIGEDHKIPLSLLPDSILGQLMYGGNVEKDGEAIVAYPTANLKAKLGITDDTIQIVNSATDDKTSTPKKYGYKTLQGAYFIVRNEFSVEVESQTVVFQKGDWLIGAGTYWDKIDNTDAVTGVKGDKEESYRIGNVNITCANVGAQPAFDDGSSSVAVASEGIISLKSVTQSAGKIGTGTEQAQAYTKAKVDDLLDKKVDKTQKVNGHALSGDITLTGADIGAAADATNGVTIDGVNYKYVHPSHTAKTNDLYKVTVDAQGHVSGTVKAALADLTAIGAADDSKVVHLAGEETITGAKTFSGNVGLPVNVKIGDLTSTGLVKYTNGVLSVDENQYITENQNITTTINSGKKSDDTTDITANGSGKTSISVTLGDSGITAGTYSAIKVNAKGIAVAGGQMINVVAYGADPGVVDGGWYFEENQAA